ncbi:MAG: VWA domain-containing protein [Spirochaetes bacterium]|nr:VWA domain-containing protein [Spirochaetota bacterium]
MDERFKRGVAHFNRKEYEASIELFRGALGKTPDDRRVRYFLALAYFLAGFEENALFELDTLVKSGGPDAVLENLVSYLYKKQFLLGGGRTDEGYAVGMAIKGNPLGKYVLSRVTGIDVDRSGDVYACGFGSKLALKISSEGKPLFSFTSPKIRHGRLYDIVAGGPVGDSVVYISDYTNDTIYKFTSEGEYLGSIGSSGLSEGSLYGPTSLALDGDGNLYVIDSGNMRVQKFSPEGRLLLVFGREGEKEGDFIHPCGIAIDAWGSIYVSDREKKTIYRYDRSGNFLSLLGGKTLFGPYGLSCTDDNRLLVCDDSRILSFDITHSVWREVQTGKKLGRVMDVKIDSLGQLYACDFENDEVVQFIPKSEKYRNLNILLNRVDTSNYPTVVYYTTVLSADGLPLSGLGPSHFLCRIGGGVVGRIDLSYTSVRDSRTTILVIVDKSLSMRGYEQDIGRFMRGFLGGLDPADEVSVIGFDNTTRILSPFTSSRITSANAITDPVYGEGRAFDRALRMGIDLLNKEFYKKAVVFVTDGSLGKDSFLTYSFEACKNYAANNGIPVYVLSFGGKNEAMLDYLARSTGGRFYDVIHSNEAPYLYDTIKSYRSPEYVIYFSDVYDEKLQGLYIDAEIEVDYSGRIGKNRLGFIYP